MVTTKTIRLDVTKPYTEPIKFEQYETDGRVLNIYLSANSTPIDVTTASVTLYATKPDDTTEYQACTVINGAAGNVTFKAPSSMCDVNGALACCIVISQDDETLRSPVFEIVVNASPDISGAAASTSQWTALEEALALVSGHEARITAAEEDIDALEADVAVIETQNNTGWIAATGTWVYASVDDPIAIITVPSGHGIEAGWYIKYIANGNTVYGIVQSVTSTTITVLVEIDPTDNLALYTLSAAHSITNAYYSHIKASGFPRDPRKWTVILDYRTETVVNNPVNGTWYNPDSQYLDIPIGLWDTRVNMCIDALRPTGVDITIYGTLSTSSSSETDLRFSNFGVFAIPSANVRSTLSLIKNKTVSLASKTRYYPLMKVGRADVTLLYARNSLSPMVIEAVNAYL